LNFDKYAYVSIDSNFTERSLLSDVEIISSVNNTAQNDDSDSDVEEIEKPKKPVISSKEAIDKINDLKDFFLNKNQDFSKIVDFLFNIENVVIEKYLNKLINWFNLPRTMTFVEKDQNFSELVEESFKIGLKQHSKLSFNSQEYLSKKLKCLIKKFDTKYYGPFTTLCQSSGFGKSRACEALVDENFYVVYCCLRKKFSTTNFPPRSTLANFLQTNQNQETLITKYKCYFNLFIDMVSSEKIGCREFFEKYSHMNKEIMTCLAENKLKSTNKNSLLSLYLGSEPLVFIFDESSSLLDSNSAEECSYFILRRVLSQLEGNVFVLFLDTFTNLSEYHPQKFADPSARISTCQKILFEPIYLLPNWDLFADYDLIQTINETVKIENICRFGRVLWGSLMHTKLNSNGKFTSVSDDKIYDLAISKLLGGKKWNVANLDKNECLAVASFRIGTIKPRRVSTCQELVANNMAICTSVSINNDFFEIEFASEPILAIASAFLINDFGIDKLLESIIQSIESSLIARGERGETIAKLILINTIDRITKLESLFKNFMANVRKTVEAMKMNGSV
ncbi:hypothetical protein BpHYR1_008492, partial [Brachionus plicatilis]